MRETELHKHIYQRSGDLGPRVAVGPGDDCAVVRTSAPLLLITVDQLIEDQHFQGPFGLHETAGTPVESVARKAVARSVSDIAAMAGTPVWGLATGALPTDCDQAVADSLFDAMSRWARHWSCPLVGGDIAAIGGGRAPVVLTVTVAGEPHPTRGPVLRSGAKPGDAVWVTGRIGGSLGSGRHLKFEPRLAEARWLADTLGENLHAMIDVSDGLGIDAGRLAAAGGVSIRFEARAVPLHADVIDWRAGIADGEDYELLFTTPGDAVLPERCPATNTRLTRIGDVIDGSGATVIDEKGVESDASAMGWDHGKASITRKRA